MADAKSQDERIAAFLDGALEGEDLRRFEDQLSSDPALAAEVERLLANDDLLRAAFAQPIDQGVDDALLSRMGLAEEGGLAQQNGANAKSLAGPPPMVAANDDEPFLSRWRLPIGAAVAASLVFALVIGLPTGTQGGMALGEALDTTPSGQFAALDDGQRVNPLLSFRAGDGRWCREFSIGEGAAAGTGIACRGSGGWQVEALTGGATTLPDGSRIAAAAGAASPTLEQAYERLSAGDPISMEQEKALISGKWSDFQN